MQPEKAVADMPVGSAAAATYLKRLCEHRRGRPAYRGMGSTSKGRIEDCSANRLSILLRR